MINIGAVPWQVWAGVAGVIALLWFGQMRYDEGWKDAMATTAQRQREAAGKADEAVDRLKSGDRSGVVQFDRD